jgi:hypothetical protein
VQPVRLVAAEDPTPRRLDRHPREATTAELLFVKLWVAPTSG